MIDLHLHTNMSDGSDTPIQLLDKVDLLNLNTFSVTDHDNIRANLSILKQLQLKDFKAKFITGCEISAIFENANLHLLCYGFDINSNSIKTLVAEGAALRILRIKAILDHLKHKHNITIPDEYKAEILNRPIPGKVHIANAVLKMGIKFNRQEFFDNCLDDCDSRQYKIEAKRVIQLVNQSGGCVCIAHPALIQKEYDMDINQISKTAKKLKDLGLSAIEVFHSVHSKQQVEQYLKIARECNLLVSAGSDYHGKNKDVKIGQVNNFGFFPKDAQLSILSLF